MCFPKRSVVFKFPQSVKNGFELLVEGVGMFKSTCGKLLFGKFAERLMEGMELIVEVIQSRGFADFGLQKQPVSVKI